MKLGVRAHDFGQLSVRELATQIARHGFSCVQLAPPKAIAGCRDGDGSLSAALAREVRSTFQQHGIEITVLGCYVNLADRNESQRRAHLERFKAYLRIAGEFGCPLVGTETGSVNSDFSRHPDNAGEDAFQVVLASVQELVHEAEQCGASVGIEAVERYVISSPARLRRLVDEVGSPRLQVIYDPVNLLGATNHDRQDVLMAQMHALLGERIRVVHAKDFTITAGRFQEHPAGCGQLHHDLLIRWLKAQPPGLPVVLENTHPATIGETVAFLREAYGRA